MSKRYLFSTLATVAVASGAMAVSPVFAPKSVLSEGRWVKVAIGKSGVYEISYDELSQMGFSNPARVSLYGRGGRMQPVSFVSADSKVEYEDDLQPVSIMHRGGKIYFYGEGTDNFSFYSSPNNYDTTKGYYVNNGRNIYSDQGYYFLTDSRTSPLLIQDTQVNDAMRPGAYPVSEGVGLVWHELDLQQNDSNTGQLFWGEDMSVTAYNEVNTKTYPVNLPDLKGDKGVMECIYYCERGLEGDNAWVTYGMTGGEIIGQMNVKDFGTLAYSPQGPSISEVSLPSGSGEVYVAAMSQTDGIARLDYWTLTYPKGIPTLRLADGSHIAQDMITLPEYYKGDVLRFSVQDAPGRVMLDISDPRHPINIPVSLSGTDGEAYLQVTKSHPSLMVFDTAKSQLRISGYSDAGAVVTNQNLHALQGEQYDFAIITLPWLMEQAEALADVHRTEDGMKVAVASAIDIYNEFSGGVPDPMAYRAFAKMLYSSSEGRLKNLLLMGPIYSDIRGMAVDRDMTQGLIGYQSEYISQEKGAFNVNDFYGMMADYIPTPFLNPEKEVVHLGVGVLPCYFASEANLYVEKLRRFYEYQREGNAFSANRRLNIGCPGNNHTHDIQATNLTGYSETLTPGLLSTNIVINAYGNESARLKTMEALNRGSQLVTYFGHGSPDRLTMSLDYFNFSHVSDLRNSTLPVMCFAGCLLSNCDRGQRGLGEALVLDTQYGLIGAVLATRDTWSNQNEEFIRTFHRSMSRTAGSINNPLVNRSRTLGEIFATTKTCSTYSNELAYLIVGDPAITVPTVLRTMGNADVPSEITLGQDQAITISGDVKYSNGSIDSDFNGTVVARILEPPVTIRSADIVPVTPAETKTIDVIYADTQITMNSASVKDGHFTVSIPVNGELAPFAGQDVTLNISAYDPATKVVMGWTGNVTVGGNPEDITVSSDDRAPVIESMAFDQASGILSVIASDDVALNLSQYGVNPGMRLHLDGSYNRAAAQSAVIPLGEGLSRVKRDIPIGTLSHGSHVARVEITDAAGNIAVSELQFEVGAVTGRFNLVMAEDALTDKATFSLHGLTPAEARFTVVDTAGRTVYSADITESEFVWDGLDYNGARVAPGRYKAYVIETGSHQSKGHSDTIDVPVI